jgi:hypothetical protein
MLRFPEDDVFAYDARAASRPNWKKLKPATKAAN